MIERERKENHSGEECYVIKGKMNDVRLKDSQVKYFADNTSLSHPPFYGAMCFIDLFLLPLSVYNILNLWHCLKIGPYGFYLCISHAVKGQHRLA